MVDDPIATPRSWVRDEAERITVEHVLGRLAGRRIIAVRYVELGYEEVPSEPFRTGPVFDWVDDAVELDLDDGATWTIVWELDTTVVRPDGTNVDYNGILVHPGRLDWLQASEHTAVWDVTEHWHANGPRDIAVVTPVWCRSEEERTSWERVRVAGHIPWRRKRTIRTVAELCLSTLILTGDDGREAVITLGERDENGRLTYACCSLAVFFSLAAARAARVVVESEAGTL